MKQLTILKFKNNENKGGTYTWSKDCKITCKEVGPGRTRTNDLLFTRQAHQPLCYRAMLHREVSRSTFTDTVMVKKPKGPMRIKTMQNVSTAKSSKTSEVLGGLEPPISCLQDRRINHYATEPCNRGINKYIH